MRVTVRSKLVVVFWELINMESGYDKKEEQGTATVTKDNEETTEKRKMNFWRKEKN